MIRNRFSLILLPALLLFACNGPTAEYQHAAPFVDGKPHIILMNPTVANIQTFLYLTREGIFPLEDDFRVVGVYHSQSSYSFSFSKNFIEKEGLDHVALVELSAPLEPGVLFRQNALSDEFETLFHRSDGIIFWGGPDIPPALYGQPTNLLTVITDPHRHYLELSFLFHLLGGFQDESFVPLLEEKPEYPVLGICLGMQSMNVATGGDMIQDIPTQVYGITTVEEATALDPNQQHRNNYFQLRSDPEIKRYSFHQMRIAPGSQMERIADDHETTPFVLSSHHQALQQLGKGFRATAWCMDDLIVEAIEHTRFPNVMGVQFHPEVTELYKPEEVLSFEPGVPGTASFPEMYPGLLGETFHRNFWKHIATQYQQVRAGE